VSLRVRGLRFTYPGWEPTLRGCTIEVGAGESGFLLGPSGSGKSTLLRCIAGLEQAYEGQVWAGEDRLDGLAPHRRRVGMLFQEPALFPHLRVWQNVAFGLRYTGLPQAQHRAEALEWLDKVGLAPRADAQVDALSGGQRQRVALVRTLAAKPRVVLLDEPFSALDRDLRDELGPWVKGLLQEQRVPALWVTHDRDEAQRWGDQVWLLVQGRCEEVTKR
jgi:ABC-type Fe3+/spermidine/putrescine transport system ATPase subunit